MRMRIKTRHAACYVRVSWLYICISYYTFLLENCHSITNLENLEACMRPLDAIVHQELGIKASPVFIEANR